MSNKSRSKHQHWVPQFYLRYFATPESRDTKTPQVWIFSKSPEDGDEQLTSVRNVCGKRYLYSPQQLDGNRDWALDDQLNDIESLLSQVWPALATDYVDMSDEPLRKALALFVAITHMRHPNMLDTVERMHAQMVKLYEDAPLDANGNPMVESIEIAGKSYPVDTSGWQEYKGQGKDGHHREFARMVRSEVGGMAKRLLTKRWAILVSDLDAFVTSDNPVALTHLSRASFGYGTQDTILTFPLSPSRVLIMDDLHGEPANQYYPVIESNIAAINMTAWRNAEKFLITGRPIPEVLIEFDSMSDVGGSD